MSLSCRSAATRCTRGSPNRDIGLAFDPAQKLRGINFLVAVIGLFGISEILLTMEERLALRGHAASISLRVVLSVWKQTPKGWQMIARQSTEPNPAPPAATAKK